MIRDIVEHIARISYGKDSLKMLGERVSPGMGAVCKDKQTQGTMAHYKAKILAAYRGEERCG